MRTIVIGDVHGCLHELEALLDKVQYTPVEDELVFVGDLMDRGPDPVGVVHKVRSLQEESPGKVVCVMGNHEDKHVRWARHEKRRRETGKANPMTPFDEKKLREHNQLTADDLRWMEELPIIHKITEGWVVVHGGLENKPLDRQDKKVAIRCRYVDYVTGHMATCDNPYDVPPNAVHWAEAWEGPENVIYGHFCESLTDVQIRGHCYGIDTGCCFGGHLTAMCIKWLWRPASITFAQVRAEDTYRVWKGGRD